MNDRYLFRAKHSLESKKWHIGNLVEEPDGLYLRDNKNNIMVYIQDPSTICQCTGKHDIPENKMIYEHDFVSFIDTYSTENGYAEQYCVGEVLWDDEELCFYVTNRLSAESYEVLDDCKVIGNRFDNPELLEV